MKQKQLPPEKQNIRVPLPYFIVLLIIIAGLIIWHFYFPPPAKGKNAGEIIKDPNSQEQINVTRGSCFNLIKPLFLFGKYSESDELLPLKEELQIIVSNKRQNKEINSAGIYFCKLDHGEWISLNGNERFNAGSLWKVPIMIYFLKIAETNPEFLERKLTFSKPKHAIPPQTFNSKSIKTGCQYTIKELLTYMIKYSDNNATYVLINNIDGSKFNAIFTDLGILKPKITSINNEMSTEEFSRFMRVLYNGSYLSPAMSQLAMEMLCDSDFSMGIKRLLPKDVVVAHKFGEANTPETHTFSESGIIYYNDDPYLLTVMAKGNNINQLIDFIGDISGFVFNKISPGQ